MKVLEGMIIGLAVTSADCDLEKVVSSETPSSYRIVDNLVVNQGDELNRGFSSKRFTGKIMENFDRIDSFKALKEGWNGYGAQPISIETINRAQDLIFKLNYQPKVFPTGRNSVQFDFFKDDDNLIEIEIFENHFDLLEIIGGNEIELSDVSEQEMIQRTTAFYAG